MIKAEICNGSDIPFEQVIDPKTTTRFVRHPAIQPCFLNVRATEEAVLVVQIDGHRIGAHRLQPGVTRIPLSLLAKPARASRFERFERLTGAHERPVPEPRNFTVEIRRGSEDGELLATYSYSLLSDAEFEKAAGSYAREIETPIKPAQYTTDATSADTAKNCWNCRQPLKGDCCTQCGCDQNDEEEQQQS